MDGRSTEGKEGGREEREGSTYLREEVEGGLAVSASRGEGVRVQAALREGDLGERSEMEHKDVPQERERCERDNS